MPTLIELPEYNFQAFLKDPVGGEAPAAFSEEEAAKVHAFHRQLPGYEPTPLVWLKGLAASWGLGGIFVKDESCRFGLKAFKALGGSYAVARLVSKKIGLSLEKTGYRYLVSDEGRRKIGRMKFTTATDGNHGRGIAWAAQQLGQEAIVYMPKGAAPSRVQNIRSHGAEVVVTDLNYDDTVRLARRNAEENGWHIVQDTAWEGYEEIPIWIMQGYMTLAKEALDQMADLGETPTHVFVQAGVGALAGGVIGYIANRLRGRLPKFIIMEPNNAACIFASAVAGDGKPHSVTGDLDTIMVGLACGEPNPLSWGILRDFPCCYVRCDDYVAANGIRILANPLPGDRFIEAGESGSVGVGLLELLANHNAFGGIKEALGIGPDSRILLLNTEGATDPVNYREILWYGKYPGPLPPDGRAAKG
ncbi:MAG: diaminopropionate ammonia-lyase [Candidatus Methanomethylicia archaeon]|nr:diaminopropionate ammonia-lyase [Candidatus Methanomethylicia archaeon]